VAAALTGPRRAGLRPALLLLLGALATPLRLAAQPPRAVVLRGGVAAFDARATLGAFTGRTTALTGAASARAGSSDTGPAAARTATGWVEVALDSLRTGNGPRDRHLREALDTPAHPIARFDLDSLSVDDGPASAASPGAADPAAPAAVRLHGRFRVHGVTRPVVATGRLQARDDGGWQLVAEFPVTLPDHAIRKGLSRAFGAVRVEPVVRVRVDLRFAP
jgi:polyisoprenoid-binding protein YceI